MYRLLELHSILPFSTYSLFLASKSMPFTPCLDSTSLFYFIDAVFLSTLIDFAQFAMIAKSANLQKLQTIPFNATHIEAFRCSHTLAPHNPAAQKRYSLFFCEFLSRPAHLNYLSFKGSFRYKTLLKIGTEEIIYQKKKKGSKIGWLTQTFAPQPEKVKPYGF